jgi:hypothetical protein
VRQESASVEIEHAAVSLGVLLEYGGRYQALNESVGEADSATANQLLGEIGADDKVAIWTYGDKVEEIAGFSDGRDALGSAVLKLRTPPFSEQNFYDALIAVVTQMHPLSRRKALLLVSSGLDTFSKANYRDALHAVGQSDTPIYAINLGPLLQQHASVSLDAGPYAHIDWKGAESKLRQIAAACGGRVYSPQAVVDLPAIFDDLMENLRVRYVITYKSTSDPNVHRARTVRVELVDSRTSEPSQPPPWSSARVSLQAAERTHRSRVNDIRHDEKRGSDPTSALHRRAAKVCGVGPRSCIDVVSRRAIQAVCRSWRFFCSSACQHARRV